MNPTPEEVAAYLDHPPLDKPFAVVEVYQGPERARFIYHPMKFPEGLGNIRGWTGNKFVAVNLTEVEAKVIVKL